jgi:RNA polymerase primary sigma factor
MKYQRVGNAFDDRKEHPAIGQLIELGQRQSYVSLNDILDHFPEAHQDIDQLEEVFAALVIAGIPLRDMQSFRDPSDEELGEESKVEFESLQEFARGQDHLANIDTDDTIGLYLKEVGRVPLLTPLEEVDLAQRIENGRLAREELAGGEVSPKRRQELQRLAEDGWLAREHLIIANSRLVISIAKQYMWRGVNFLDLIQEGNIGLMRAVKKFDYHRGYKFSTYAHWWIRQAITRAIADQGRTIRVPVHMADQISSLLRMQHKLTQQLGRDPSNEELAVALDLPPLKVENLVQVALLPLSLETPADAEDDSVLGDFIPDEQVSAPDETATYHLLRRDLEQVFKELPPREVRILQLRYGLLDGKVYTLEEVGRKMGVTRERVRQIEAQALSRLRHPDIRRMLQEYLR